MRARWMLLVTASLAGYPAVASTKQSSPPAPSHTLSAIEKSVAGTIVVIGGELLTSSERSVSLVSRAGSRDVRVLYDSRRVKQMSATSYSTSDVEVLVSRVQNFDFDDRAKDQGSGGPSKPVRRWKSIRASSAVIDMSPDGSQSILLSDAVIDSSTAPIDFVTLKSPSASE